MIENHVMELRQKCDSFKTRLMDRKKELESFQKVITDRSQKIRNMVKDHLKLIYESKYAQLVTEINENDQKKLSKFNEAFDQYDQVQAMLQQNLELFDELISNNNSNNNSIDLTKTTNIDNVDFTEDDALMINEDANDYDDLSSTRISDSKSEQLEKIIEKIESIINSNLLLDDILNNNADIDTSVVEFTKCTNADLQSICFGHIKLNIIDFLIDHTSFELVTKLNDNFSYIVSEECGITIKCPDVTGKNIDSKIIHDNLDIVLLDPYKKPLDCDLREKRQDCITKLKICFIPQKSGIYSLSIKYKNVHINNSPFNFVVLPCKLQQNNNNISQQSMQVNINDDHTSNNQTNNGTRSSNITRNRSGFGRGQLLKSNNNTATNKPGLVLEQVVSSSLRKNSTSSEYITSLISPAQKRKSNDNFYFDEEMKSSGTDTPMSDITKRFNKFSYEDQSFKPYTTSLNINTGADAHDSSSKNNLYQNLNIISSHLRKYSSGLVTLAREIPPLRAELVLKFEKCNFPIGVRPTKFRNYLIVCDSGANALKFFDNQTGKLMHEIKDRDNFVLRRPSACLVNTENDREIFVKDDKEILVFDLSDFSLKRKFGHRLLQRPYGLAFDSNRDLVLVDADVKLPRVLKFNKQNGEIIHQRAFEPMTHVAKSNTLIATFCDKNANNRRRQPLSNQLEPVEKSKIRFLCCNADFLYAADLGRSIVYKTNLDGEIQLAFGHHGKRKGEMNEPSGIFVDQDGESILVGDSKNDRIQIYDKDGYHKCDLEFIGEKIVRPSDIHVDENGYLYVSCFIKQCVMKFKLIATD